MGDKLSQFVARKNVFISHPFLRDLFSKRRILSWQFFSAFGTLIMLFLVLLAPSGCGKKSGIILTTFPLDVTCLFFSFSFFFKV